MFANVPGGGAPAFLGAGKFAAATNPAPPPQSTSPDQQPSPIPGVDLYGQAALAAKTAYQKALAQINNQRHTALQQYGYLGDIDPNTGTLTNMRVDPNNPYGAFQEMLSSHAQQQEAARNAAAARGLGHGGLAAQGITADHRAFGADSAQLGQSLMSQLEGLQQQQTDAQNTMDSALYQAELDQARNAIANGMFDTADTSGVDIPAYGSGAGQSPAGSPGAPSKTPAKKPAGPESITAAQQALAALHARSAALNARYGLNKPSTNRYKKKRG